MTLQPLRPAPDRTTRPAARANFGLAGPELEPAELRRISQIAHRAAGLAIGPAKAAMVRTRLARRLRALSLPDYAAYCAYLDSEHGADEIGLLVSALTTNVSNFFREAHHFESLRRDVLPPLVARAAAGERVRIWSAGCANGQEPYSVAMTMIELGMRMEGDVRVLATDIDPNVIAHARAGDYPESMLTGLPDDQRARFFKPGSAATERTWRTTDALRDSVQFRVLNLLDPWPMRGMFDVIFCRNVVIYFDAETQDRLWHRFADQLAPGGWLFIGHSERLSAGVQDRFQGRGITVYQKVGGTTGTVPQHGPSHKRT